MAQSTGEMLRAARAAELREQTRVRQARFARGLRSEKIAMPDWDAKPFASDAEAKQAFMGHASQGLQATLARAAITDAQRRQRDSGEDE